MRRILTVLSILVLSTFVTIGQGQQVGDLRNNLSGNLVGEFYHVQIDTNFIVNWDFEAGMPPYVTEVGGVSVVSFGGSNVLKVDVVGGGSDYILKTIVPTNEYWYKLDVYLTDIDTSGWADNEQVVICNLKNSVDNDGLGNVAIRRVSGALKWRVWSYDDAGNPGWGTSTATLSTNTWYSLLWHVRKSTSAGADDGISNLEVNGVADIVNITDWDNDAAAYVRLWVGGSSSTLNAIYYVDPVVVWSNEGLP